MRCEDVRPLLPDLAEGSLRAVGDVERHLSSCPACSTELGRYRTVVLEMAALRDVLAESPSGFLERVLDQIPARTWRSTARRVAANERVQNAAFSVGGALVGAGAIALLWWRAGRRSLGTPQTAAPAS